MLYFLRQQSSHFDSRILVKRYKKRNKYVTLLANKDDIFAYWQYFLSRTTL